MSADAAEVWHSWREATEPRLDPHTGDLRGLVDWANKHPGHVARLAALLHLAAGGALDGEVSADTMSGAVALWDYFCAHAQRAFVVMSESPEARVAKKALGWIVRKAVAEFSRRDLWQGVKGGIVQRAADLDPSLDLLTEHGYVMLLGPPVDKGQGRPHAPRYAVNPAIATPNTPNTRAQRVSGGIGGTGSELRGHLSAVLANGLELSAEGSEGATAKARAQEAWGMPSATLLPDAEDRQTSSIMESKRCRQCRKLTVRCDQTGEPFCLDCAASSSNEDGAA